MTAPERTSSSLLVSLRDADMDLLLTAQIALAWAGEGGEEPRLGWWRTDLASEYGGEDLFQRLLPQTWRWAVLQGVREAARRQDARLRSQSHDPDEVFSLYRLGFQVDERAEERLQDLKRSGKTPEEALPGLQEVFNEEWDARSFEEWLKNHGSGEYETTPAGRKVKGDPPDSFKGIVQALLASLLPLAERYPLPHFRRAQ